MSIPDYNIFSSYLPVYEQQINEIYSSLNDDSSNESLEPASAGELPQKSYFLCFINRAGSNLLSEVLTKTGRMGRPAEIFNPEPIRNISRRNNIRSISDYLDWQLRTNTVGGVFAAKVGIHQLAYLVKENLIAKKFPNPEFVYITRKDILMQAISLNVAWQTGAWTSRSTSNKQPIFDPDGIASQIRAICDNQAGFEAFFSVHGIEPLRLTYEAIEQNLDAALQSVCHLVGVGVGVDEEIHLPSATLKKQRTSRNIEWAEQFRNMYLQHLNVAVTPDSTNTGNYKVTLQRLDQSIRKGDAAAAEKIIRHWDYETLIEDAEATLLGRARRWVAARALADGKIDLAREMFQPLSPLLPMSVGFLLPDIKEDLLKQVSSNYPDWREIVVALGYSQWRRGAFKDAASTLDRLVKPGEVTDELGHVAAEIYCDSLYRTGEPAQFSALLALCSPLLTDDQVHRYPFIYLGYVAFMQRNLQKESVIASSMRKLMRQPTLREIRQQEAFELFSEAAKRPQGIIPLSGGCLSVVNPLGIKGIDSIPEPIDLLGDVTYAPDNDYNTQGAPILFFACDSVYLRDYALLLVASAARINPELVCHIHVVDPDDETSKVIADIRNRFTAVRINVSHERCLLRQRKPFYASIRFIRANEILERYRSPLFIVDVDLIVEVSMHDLMEIVGECEIGLIVRTAEPTFPWTAVQAGTAYFTDSEKSRRFLELTRKAILLQLSQDNELPIWYVDQNALFAAYEYMKEELLLCNLLSPRERPIYTCYTRTVARKVFTQQKMEEFGLC